MIITNNEQLLRIECEPVIEAEVGELVKILEKELINSARLGNPGIGLAASQIGIAKDIAIVRIPNRRDLDINLVNAKIINKYDPAVFTEEGCLSFPGRVEDTVRYQEIVVSNFNLIKPINFIATGLISVVCQHEIDHLNKKLFFDSATPKLEVKKKKTGPNDPCACGSLIKYKKCCGKK